MPNTLFPPSRGTLFSVDCLNSRSSCEDCCCRLELLGLQSQMARLGPVYSSDEETARLDSYDHAIVAVLLFLMLGFLFREAIKYRRGRQRLLQLQDELESAGGTTGGLHAVVACWHRMSLRLRQSLSQAVNLSVYEQVKPTTTQIR